MPEETVTGATGDNPEVTDSSEGPESPESTTQNSTKQFEELEAKFKKALDDLQAEAKRNAEYQQRMTEIEEARKKAEQAKEFELNKYKGLQRETNKKDDAIKRLEAQVAAQASIQNQINKVERIVAALAQQSLDADTVAGITQAVEREATEKELERLRNQVAQAATPRPFDEGYKSDLYYKWFADEFPDVNPLDLSYAEWHVNGANTEQEWVALVRAEFEKHSSRSKAPAAPSATDVVEKVRSEFEAQMKAQREEAEKQIAEANAKIAKTQAELEEKLRVTQEQLNRSKGMDRSLDAVGSPELPSTRKVAAELAQLNDNDLYSPDKKVRDEYSRKLNDKSLRDKLIADMLARQSKQ